MKTEYNENGIEALAIAITHRAALDYQKELDKSRETGQATSKLLELKEWFKSELGQLCSFGAADFIVKQIHNGAELFSYDHRGKYTSKYSTPPISKEDIDFIKTHYKPRDKKYNLCTLAKMFNVPTTFVWNLIHGGYSFE